MSAPVTTGDAALDTVALTREVVAAINRLNRIEFLERGRELKLRRSAGKRPMADLVDLDTGEILDELPPEEIFRMMDELEKDREGEK